MPLTELQAQQIALVRVLEQTRDNGGVWTASDAREATRAARELVGPRAPFEAFVARRAQWALDEIGRSKPAQAIRLHTVRAPFWNENRVHRLATQFDTEMLQECRRSGAEVDCDVPHPPG